MRTAPLAILLLALAPSAIAQEPQGIPALPDGVTLASKDSGLKWVELEAGDGTVKPVVGDKVLVYYTGWLKDGTVFDARPERGEPARFTCGQLIAAWNEALQEMSPGSRWRIEVPPDLGYGERGSPPVIPGGATLTFELALVGVEKPPAFVPLDQEKSKTTASGIRYQPLVEGSGEVASADRVLKMNYSIWDRDGRMLDSTFSHERTLDGKTSDMRLPFLREIPLLLRVGGSCLVEATKAQSFPDGFPPPWGALPGDVTIWKLELQRALVPLPLPEFRMPGPDAPRLEGGVTYEVLKDGAGESPGPTDVVRCHYAGWLSDGSLFDASYPRGEPIEIRGVQVIPGWNQALQKMKPGAVWLVSIPPEQGYGAQGRPPRIPGNSVLVFQVELLDVVERAR